jgi:AcrR family transcriptional regulator
VGSFYARFAGKDELLAYLGERIWREAAERWDEALAAQAWDGLGLPKLVEGAVRLLSEAGRSRDEVLRALERAPGARADAYRSLQAHVLQGLEGLLLARAGEMDHPEPPVAVRLGLRAVLAVLEEPAPDAAAAIPEERRREEAARLLLTYLTGREGRRPGPPDFFEIWS